MKIITIFFILACVTSGHCSSFAFLDQLLPSGEWQVNKSLAECNEYLFRHKVAADVTFVVSYKDGPSGGTPVSFQAHRLLLLARSPVFFDMFNMNTSFSLQVEIEVTDVDPDAFNEMLRFIYYDEAEIIAENVLYVLQAAKKYKLPNLDLKCSQFLGEKLDANNVFGILEHSIFFKDQRLIKKALNLIKDNGQVALSSEAFSKLSRKAIGQVLDMDVISAREIDIFNACMTWAWAECDRQSLEKNSTNARMVLGEYLYMIRFPTMSLKEFADQVVPMNLLDTEEGYIVFQYMTCTDKPSNMAFPTKRRRGLANNFVILTSLTPKYVEASYERSAIITIEIDQNINLTDIYFHGLNNEVRASYKQNNFLKIEINIKQNDNLLFESASTKEAASEHKKIDSLYPFISVPVGNGGVNVAKGKFTIWTKYVFGYTRSCCPRDKIFFLSTRRNQPLQLSDEQLKVSVSMSEYHRRRSHNQDSGHSEYDFPFLGFRYVI